MYQLVHTYCVKVDIIIVKILRTLGGKQGCCWRCFNVMNLRDEYSKLFFYVLTHHSYAFSTHLLRFNRITQCLATQSLRENQNRFDCKLNSVDYTISNSLTKNKSETSQFYFENSFGQYTCGLFSWCRWFLKFFWSEIHFSGYLVSHVIVMVFGYPIISLIWDKNIPFHAFKIEKHQIMPHQMVFCWKFHDSCRNFRYASTIPPQTNVQKHENGVSNPYMFTKTRSLKIRFLKQRIDPNWIPWSPNLTLTAEGQV